MNRGGPEKPLNPVELMTKFQINAKETMTSARADVAFEAMNAPPSSPDLAALTAPLRSPLNHHHTTEHRK